MANRSFDAVVIGGGPAGYSCAIRLGQLKQKVACIEKEEVGGVCLNWGCIPSKALISASHLYHRTLHAETMGIKVQGATIDVGAMQDWKNGIVKKLVGGVRGLLKGNGAELVSGTATVVRPNAVAIATAKGEQELIETRTIVLATGSSTIELPAFKFDGKKIIGAKEAVSLREVPKRMLVIGGGVIGLELGCVYQKLGSEITVVEMTPTLLPGTDPDCTQVMERKFVRAGGKVHKSAKALGFESMTDGSLAVRVETVSSVQTMQVDVVLVAVGMRPNSRGLGLEALGVQVDPRGFIQTDATCRTNVAGVYAIGDVSGPPLLAHKASKEAEVVAEVIAGHKASKDWASIPSAIFTDPEIATVGLTEAQAKEQGIAVTVGKMPFAASGRAMAVGEPEGFVKIVADKNSHQILGFHIVGPEASDLISEGSLALEMGAFLEDVGMTIHPHPTLGEAVMIAANHGLGQAIDIMNR
jgi:dihydrolipoamide dehydrogenase